MAKNAQSRQNQNHGVFSTNCACKWDQVPQAKTRESLRFPSHSSKSFQKCNCMRIRTDAMRCHLVLTFQLIPSQALTCQSVCKLDATKWSPISRIWPRCAEHHEKFTWSMINIWANLIYENRCTLTKTLLTVMGFSHDILNGCFQRNSQISTEGRQIGIKDFIATDGWRDKRQRAAQSCPHS